MTRFLGATFFCLCVSVRVRAGAWDVASLRAVTARPAVLRSLVGLFLLFVAAAEAEALVEEGGEADEDEGEDETTGSKGEAMTGTADTSSKAGNSSPSILATLPTLLRLSTLLLGSLLLPWVS